MNLADALNVLVEASKHAPSKRRPIDHAYAITVRSMQEAARRGLQRCCLPEGLVELNPAQLNRLLVILGDGGIMVTKYTFAYDTDPITPTRSGRCFSHGS